MEISVENLKNNNKKVRRVKIAYQPELPYELPYVYRSLAVNETKFKN